MGPLFDTPIMSHKLGMDGDGLKQPRSKQQ